MKQIIKSNLTPTQNKLMKMMTNNDDFIYVPSD